MSSSYLRAASGTENVGLFYGVVFACVLGLLFLLPGFIRRLGKTTLLSLLLFFLALAMLVLSILSPSFLGMALLGTVIVINSVAWVVIDIILEDFSTDNSSGRIRGWHLMLMNTGILAGPLLASQLMDRVGFWGIFLASAFLYVLVFLWIILGLHSVNFHFKREVAWKGFWRKIRTTPDILRIYGVSFALEFFYVVMIVYMPLRLLDLGFSWTQIGLIFTVMLLPFVIIQYPLGVLADKRWGEKEMLLIALAILAVSTGVAAFSSSTSLGFWMVVLFVTRIGAAAIEVLRDAYFYKQIDGDDGDIIAFFRTTRPTANIVVAILGAVLLLWFPLTIVFILSVLVSMSVLCMTFSLKDTVIDSA
ncbi:MAG: MFS transporter [Candidatus Moraniibacteriota bacterium]